MHSDAQRMRGRDSHLPCLLLFIVCMIQLLHIDLVFPLYSPLRCFCVINHATWTIPGKTPDQRAIILN